ncbi:MAG: DUF4388 domain-containing protein [Chloroflexota bacterium]
MALKGNLAEISLTNLVQLNCQSGMSGQLTVSQDELEAQVFFSEGEIVHAVLGDSTGTKAFNQLLSWEDGQFEMEPGISAPAQSISTSWSDLLLGGLHQLDETKAAKQPGKTKQQVVPEDLGNLFGLEKSTGASDASAKITEDIMAQNLQEHLLELGNESPAIFAAAVVGMDGLTVADYTSKKVSIEGISAQMTLLIKLIDTTTKKLAAGSVEDFLLTTDKSYLLIRFLGSTGYYLGIAAERSKDSLGKMRLYSRIYAERLSASMPK